MSASLQPRPVLVAQACGPGAPHPRRSAPPRRRAPRSAASSSAPSAIRLVLAPSRVRRSAVSRSASWRTMRSRTSTASGLRARARARPGDPAAARARVAARAASASPSSWSRSAMASLGTGPRRTRAERLATVGRMVAGSSAHSTMQASPTGSSSVLSRAFWASGLRRCADSMTATRRRASMGSSASSDDECLDLGQPDLLAGAFRRDPMEVRMIAVVDLATRGAGATRAVERVIGRAQEPGREVERQGRLAHAGGPTMSIECGARPRAIARWTPARASEMAAGTEPSPRPLHQTGLSPRPGPPPWWSGDGSSWRVPRRPRSPARRSRSPRRPWWCGDGSSWRVPRRRPSPARLAAVLRGGLGGAATGRLGGCLGGLGFTGSAVAVSAAALVVRRRVVLAGASATSGHRLGWSRVSAARALAARHSTVAERARHAAAPGHPPGPPTRARRTRSAARRGPARRALLGSWLRAGCRPWPATLALTLTLTLTTRAIAVVATGRQVQPARPYRSGRPRTGSRRGASARATSARATSARAGRPATTLLPALREEVLRDLRLVVVALLVVRRGRADGRAGRDAHLALPDGAEGGVLRQWRDLLLEELVLEDGLARWAHALEAPGAHRGLALGATPTTTSATTPPAAAAAALALLGRPLGGVTPSASRAR